MTEHVEVWHGEAAEIERQEDEFVAHRIRWAVDGLVRLEEAAAEIVYHVGSPILDTPRESRREMRGNGAEEVEVTGRSAVTEKFEHDCTFEAFGFGLFDNAERIVVLRFLRGKELDDGLVVADDGAEELHGRAGCGDVGFLESARDRFDANAVGRVELGFAWVELEAHLVEIGAEGLVRLEDQVRGAGDVDVIVEGADRDAWEGSATSLEGGKEAQDEEGGTETVALTDTAGDEDNCPSAVPERDVRDAGFVVHGAESGQELRSEFTHSGEDRGTMNVAECVGAIEHEGDVVGMGLEVNFDAEYESLQAAGSPGVLVYTSGSATSSTIVTFDDLAALSVTAP